MSALARHFNQLGIAVSGYDKTSTVLSKELEAEGIRIHYEDNVDLIDKDANLVVYTPAIPSDHKEYNYFKNNNYEVVKRSDVLKLLSAEGFNVCVAGTHGKTTISTMVAHILRHSGLGCTAILGGISVNYNTNYWKGDNNIFVIEADEYDRSFLKLYPNIASISAMDADHLDIYGTAEAVEEAFIDFSKNIKEGGLLISKHGLKRGKDLQASRSQTYSLYDESTDFYTKDLKIKDGGYCFTVVCNGKDLGEYQLNIGGMHNVENSLVAIAIANELNITPHQCIDAISSFKGVKRRFEYIIRNEEHGKIYIDDYAHHPEELKALISSAKSLFPDRNCMVIFQPHLFSRTQDLAKEFAEALDLADRVILLPIYPARELPIPGITSEIILNKMSIGKKWIMSKEELLEWMKIDVATKNVLYITAGAGDIDSLIEPLKNIISSLN